MNSITPTPVPARKKSFRDLLSLSISKSKPQPPLPPSSLDVDPDLLALPPQLDTASSSSATGVGAGRSTHSNEQPEQQDVKKSLALLESTLASLGTLGIVPGSKMMAREGSHDTVQGRTTMRTNGEDRRVFEDADEDTHENAREEAEEEDDADGEEGRGDRSRHHHLSFTPDTSFDLDEFGGEDMLRDLQSARIQFMSTTQPSEFSTIPNSFSKSSISSSALDNILDLGQFSNFDDPNSAFLADSLSNPRFHDEFTAPIPPSFFSSFPVPPTLSLDTTSSQFPSLPPGARRQSYSSMSANMYNLPDASTSFINSPLVPTSASWSRLPEPSVISPAMLQKIAQVVGVESQKAVQGDQKSGFSSLAPSTLVKSSSATLLIPTSAEHRPRKLQTSRSFSAPTPKVTRSTSTQSLHISSPILLPSPTLLVPAPQRPPRPPSPPSPPLVRRNSFAKLRRRKSSLPIAPDSFHSTSSIPVPALPSPSSIVPEPETPSKRISTWKRLTRKSEPPPIPTSRQPSTVVVEIKPRNISLPTHLIARDLTGPTSPSDSLLSPPASNYTNNSPKSTHSMMSSPDSPVMSSSPSSFQSESYFAPARRSSFAHYDPLQHSPQAGSGSSSAGTARKVAVVKDESLTPTMTTQAMKAESRMSSCFVFEPALDQGRLEVIDVVNVAHDRERKRSVDSSVREKLSESSGSSSAAEGDDVPLGTLPGALKMQASLVQSQSTTTAEGKMKSSHAARIPTTTSASRLPIITPIPIPIPSSSLLSPSIATTSAPGVRNGKSLRPQQPPTDILLASSTQPLRLSPSLNNLNSATPPIATTDTTRRTSMSARIPPPRLPPSLNLKLLASPLPPSPAASTSPRSPTEMSTKTTKSSSYHPGSSLGSPTFSNASESNRSSKFTSRAPSSAGGRSSHNPSSSNRLPPTVPASSYANLSLVSHRVFIRDQSQHTNIIANTLTTCGEIVAEARGRGLLVAGNEATEGGYALWEVWNDMGTQRPIREFELLSDVIKSWSHDSNVLLIRRSLLWSSLSSHTHASPTTKHGGWLQVELKRGKWFKRYVELNEGVLSCAKTEKMKDSQILCNLVSFDGFYLTPETAAMIKAPKPFSFALKSILPRVHYENGDEYCHYLSAKTEVERDGWINAIIDARNSALRQRARDMRTAHTTSSASASAHNGNANKSFAPPLPTHSHALPSSSSVSITTAAIAALSSQAATVPGNEKNGSNLRAKSLARMTLVPPSSLAPSAHSEPGHHGMRA